MHKGTNRWLTRVAIGLAGIFFATGAADACPSARAISGLLARPVASPVVAATSNANSNSIVGLWQVTYSVGGGIWDRSFETWHADGTEFENAMDSPLISAVCQGVWIQIGSRTVKLHHLGWSYDATGTVLLGTFSLDQVNTLAPGGNAYTGRFVFQPYDLNGDPAGPPLEGTVSATRVAIN
jgi:hypothetical protein